MGTLKTIPEIEPNKGKKHTEVDGKLSPTKDAKQTKPKGLAETVEKTVKPPPIETMRENPNKSDNAGLATVVEASVKPPIVSMQTETEPFPVIPLSKSPTDITVKPVAIPERPKPRLTVSRLAQSFSISPSKRGNRLVISRPMDTAIPRTVDFRPALSIDTSLLHSIDVTAVRAYRGTDSSVTIPVRRSEGVAQRTVHSEMSHHSESSRQVESAVVSRPAAVQDYSLVSVSEGQSIKSSSQSPKRRLLPVTVNPILRHLGASWGVTQRTKLPVLSRSINNECTGEESSPGPVRPKKYDLAHISYERDWNTGGFSPFRCTKREVSLRSSLGGGRKGSLEVREEYGRYGA